LYDFGDNWEHSITLIGRSVTSTSSIICLSGEGGHAAEDCGGAQGWQKLKTLYAEHGREEEWECTDPSAHERMEWYEEDCLNGQKWGLTPGAWDKEAMNKEFAATDSLMERIIMPPERQKPRTTPGKTVPRSKELEPLIITNIDELKASKTYGQRVKYFEKRNSLDAPAGKFFTLHSCPTFSFSALHYIHPSIRNKDLKPTVKRLALLDRQCVIAPWENGKWLDKDGVPLIHYFNGLVQPELSDALINELYRLAVRHPPQKPGRGESRHCGFTAWKNSVPPGTPCGVL
jgi:hypothetical protein